MLRDFKFLRRNSGKNEEELENLPTNPNYSTLTRPSLDSARPPLNSIQDPAPLLKPDPEVSARSKVDKTPIKEKSKGSDQSALPLRTPDNHRAGLSVRNRLGFGQTEEGTIDLGKGGGHGNGGFSYTNTPRTTTRAVGRAVSGYSEANSTQSTPTKSVSKPPSSSYRNKLDGNASSARAGNFAGLYKGIPINSGPFTVVNSVEVPHFDLKEDPSFWMDHNVQVLIRVRPLNSIERSTHGYNRCLKQESAQSITWIGHPEARFTFDHVACETVDQEMLFRMAGLPMVENCLSGYNSCMFAYGQTGSGKTYTMLGEIGDLEVKPSQYRGMTPRVFEFLFARIQAEEEIQRDEKLKYNCKCSFLEIYNEQITDLLDPSSTNLHLREDVKKGVYVENLSEFEVHTVNDIIKLLTQGSLNRKVAATNMNRESSRSHSVFTCVIESSWEKNSTTNLRFARLNLVDLAGSERQKASGAEGERLKEAASINKSLSTLGHVIMVLVDVANGKQRHVPYRDSRLTFLLQDSLGGNSKTMIIANVSPSICCAAETLNTLKFAQRAKLIQNNAVVNEDSTGDVFALQHQIRLLKEELYILKRQNVYRRSLEFGPTTVEDATEPPVNSWSESIYSMENGQDDELIGSQSKEVVRLSTKQLKSLEMTLAGALRREQMAEASIKQLEAEIEQLKRLVRQREEDTRCTKMMLRFREEKIKRMETLVGGLIPNETYLLEENKALSEDIQLLQAKLDRNPEVTRFALENIRLLDQIRRFQEFYEEGERGVLMDEVSTLRDQLLLSLGGNFEPHNHSSSIVQPQKKNNPDELAECKRNLNSCLDENVKLSREIDNLHCMLNSLRSAQNEQSASVDSMKGLAEYENEKMVQNHEPSSMVNHAEEIVNLQLELDILKIILKEERFSRGQLEEKTMTLNIDLDQVNEKILLVNKQYEDANNELKEAKSIIDALEAQQVLSINEIEDLKRNQEHEIIALKEQLACKELNDLSHLKHLELDGCSSPLQSKMKRMQYSLDKAKRLNSRYQTDREFQAFNEEEMDEVRRQVEAETAEVIVCLQEELVLLQQQVQDDHLKEMEMNNDIIYLESNLKQMEEKLYLLTEDNERLGGMLMRKDKELRVLSEECEIFTGEMEEVLSDGSRAFIDACDQLDSISSSFPEKRIWISEQVNRIVSVICEKESMIEELRRCLEDANNKRIDLETMLKSLRGAAMVITEAHQQECLEKENEILHLTSIVRENESSIAQLENQVKLAEDHLVTASTCATVAFVVVNRLSEINSHQFDAFDYKVRELNESQETNLRKDTLLDKSETEIQSLKEQLAETERACSKLCKELSEEKESTFSMKQKLEDIEGENILKTREKLAELKIGVSTLRSCMSSYSDQYSSPKEDNLDKVSSSYHDKANDQTHAEAHQENNIDLNDIQEPKNEMLHCSLKLPKRDCGYPCIEENDVRGRDTTILLLKKEIESALESLKEVQAEMSKLQNEKEEMLIHEKQSQDSMKILAIQVLTLQETINNIEKIIDLKIEAFNHRLKAFENAVEETASQWGQTKEFIELEVGDAMVAAAHKTAEASCILTKFEEAQDTMKEADIMINELMIANETMKLDIKRLTTKTLHLTNDRDTLRNEIQTLEQQFVELEGILSEVQTSVNANFMSLDCDLTSTKSLVSSSTKLMHSWVGNLWSDIIAKDCVVSVLHLCHMGILLETVTGMNVENGLLQHGLCESNAMIADLREHNLKSIRELDMCRVLKGKLLTDLTSSFDRIQRKEEETEEINEKLTTFQKKISDFQLQEELMFQRYNFMGSQLDTLMNELDSSNKHAVGSLLDHERHLKDKEDLLESQNEFLMENWCLENFEALIFAAELEAMNLQKADYLSALENLKNHLTLAKVDEELRKRLLEEKEVEAEKLLNHGEAFEAENGKLVKELKVKEKDMQHSSTEIASLHQQNQLLEKEICMLENSSYRLQNVLEMKDVELCNLSNLEKENELLISELMRLMIENVTVLRHLEERKSDFDSSQASIHAFRRENQRLQDEVFSLETRVSCLVNDLGVKSTELIAIEHSQTACMEESYSKSQDLQLLKEENVFLKKELQLLEKTKLDILNRLSLNTVKCVESVEAVNSTSSKIHEVLTEGPMVLDKMSQEMLRNVDTLSRFVDDIESLECHAKEVVAENLTLQAELQRRDEVLTGLLFDLSLLQESASNTKDQRDEIEEIKASMEALEDELEEAIANNHMLEAQLQENEDTISALEVDLSKDRESLELLSGENMELRAKMEDALVAKTSFEQELTERKKIIESMELELSDMENALSKMNDMTGSLQNNLDEVAGERDHFQDEVISLKEKLERAKARSEEAEANLMEVQQIAESRNICYEEKEAEVKLLERSVEELECIISVLENKVDIVKGEAERQRLQREELESELHSIKHHMENFKNADAELKRSLDEKERNLQEAQKHIKILQPEVAAKSAEIAQLKTHISELQLHAEAQANENKQKFKALEVMAEQVKPEGVSLLSVSSSSNKSDKYPMKSRGSGSPFKCIGLGLAHQIKSENHEELAAARNQIEELESLAVSRQKEIFTLNARLAAAESMTHDVIRDLLGVKLDMTTYVSLLDKQQIQKITEKAQLNAMESQDKAQEVTMLKNQLNEFIEERQGWLEEIDRKQAEMIATQVGLEKLRQREQLLKTENDMLKIENGSHKKRIIELEGEVKNLSGQQNLQQRIHHHAKIKEENNILRGHNEDLSGKLRRTEILLSRVKQELAHYRSSMGRNSCIDFDEEDQLSIRLKETEEEKVQLAQKLLGLCTKVLKVAGITKPASDISQSPSDAEEALEQFVNITALMERELHDLKKFKRKITKSQAPTVSSRAEENCESPKRSSQGPSFSNLDR